ncbi:E3 ubiquitin-protein ligase TRIM4 isoform X2 [Microcebus murinus]|uniref:E3 ubiquitin-protein ligase TRIM4 isoform X2 n=1 Tax=Microcebus murinus TaxID=30608 RepID=UPI003F6AB401
MEAEDLQEELTCSICLDYFEDPVSIECGHNFCRGCLRRSWTPGGGLFSCPECRQPSAPAALRPNWALARLTEKTRRRRKGPVPPGLCSRHWEPLRLFCENDQRPVCLVCRESQGHQAHTMAPIDEAFQSYRVQIKNQRMRIATEFSKLHNFLTEEEQLFLQRLNKEEEETKKKLKENMLRLNETIISLKKLIIEVGEKSQASALQLLQNPKDMLIRSEMQDVNCSLEVLKVKTVCQLPMMKEMLKRYQVAVNVAEETAHPKLVFAQEGRYVKNAATESSWPVFSTAWNYFAGWKNSQKTTHIVEKFQHLPCVLGKNIFTSGKHYWEVENRGGLEIAAGVCQEDIMGITDSSRMSPHSGIWAIQWSSAGYRPLTSLPLDPPNKEPALLRVGVYLDHEARSVSFYSAVDGLHLHTFSCSFVSHLRPFFWLGPLASLVIPRVTDGK